ncbi:MAG: lipoprotein [Legionellaceae bacterium]|nr:lipoprotein [Legionellaceae bacterium]
MQRLTITLLFVCLVTACGQKGKLYLPDNPPSQHGRHSKNEL